MGASASVGDAATTTAMTTTTTFFGKECEVQYESEAARERLARVIAEATDEQKTRAEMADLVRDQCAKVGLELTINDEAAEKTLVVVRERKSANEPLSDEEVDRMVQLLRANAAPPATTQTVVVFVDGSDRAHEAFSVAKTFLKAEREDEMAVVSVASEKGYLGPNYAVSAIQTRYEAALTPLLPAKRWTFVGVPKSGKQTKQVVADFVNHRDTLKPATNHYELGDPTLVVVGFSGRKASKDRDPSVVGQVADLSLRTILCPVCVIKSDDVKAPGQRHFLMLVDLHPRCLMALATLVNLIHDGDKLTLLHVQNLLVPTSSASPEKRQADEEANARDTKAAVEQLYAPFAARCATLEYLENDRVHWRSRTDMITTELNDNDKYRDVDFVAIACRPKPVLGSISDALVKTFAGNLILIKAVE